MITPPDISDEHFESVKNYLRVDHDDDDDLIILLMRATREYAEETLCRRAFELQTLEYSTRNTTFQLPRPPLKEIECVQLVDSAGISHALTENDYQIIHDETASDCPVTIEIVSSLV